MDAHFKNVCIVDRNRAGLFKNIVHAYLDFIRIIVIKFLGDQFIDGILHENILNGIISNQEWPQLLLIKIDKPLCKPSI